MGKRRRNQNYARSRRRIRRKGLALLLGLCVIICLIFVIKNLLVKQSGFSIKVGKNEAGSIGEAEVDEDSAIILGGTETEKVATEKIVLMAVGDNLVNKGVYRSGVQADGSRNYDHLYRGILPYLEKADIKIINQETVFAGNDKEFTFYPTFNSPTEIGDAIAKAGFNVVLTATNHILDKGRDGMYANYNFWKEKYPEIIIAGTHEEGDRSGDYINYMNIKGVSIAIIDCSYYPHNCLVGEENKLHVNQLCALKDNGESDFRNINPELLEAISLAESTADFTIVCPHWGNEYQTTVSQEQEKFARQMTEAGADLIIGTHPHVIEPVEKIMGDNGNEALCFYSLGNYTSTQDKPIAMLEAMAYVTLIKDEEGIHIDYDETHAIPMVCHFPKSCDADTTYPLSEYTRELANEHGITYFNETISVEFLQENAQAILGEWME